MSGQIGFILKVVLVSTILSLLVKYGGRILSIPPTPTNASIAILIPPILMALVLWWRLLRKQQID
jgi:hypothetical protein